MNIQWTFFNSLSSLLILQMIYCCYKPWLLLCCCSSENSDHRAILSFGDESEVPVVLRPVTTCYSSHTGVNSSNRTSFHWWHTFPAWQPHNRMWSRSRTQPRQKGSTCTDTKTYAGGENGEFRCWHSTLSVNTPLILCCLCPKAKKHN